VVESVRRVVAVGELTDLVDDEHVRAYVLCEGLAHAARATRRRQRLDRFGGVDEEGSRNGAAATPRTL
jgi:hypothetical protein